MAYHNRRQREMLKRMKARYLTEIATNYRFRNWTNSLGSAQYHRPTVRKLN